MKKEVMYNQIVKLKLSCSHFICYAFLFLIITSSCGVYIYKNIPLICDYFIKLTSTTSGVSHLSIPRITVSGAIYKNEKFLTSMSKGQSLRIQKLSENTEAVINSIIINNFGDFNAKNVYIDIVIDDRCIEYLQKFIEDNGVDFKFSTSSTEKSNKYTEYEISYSSTGSMHSIKDRFQTGFIPSIQTNSEVKLAIPHNLYFYIKLMAHLAFFYNESLDIERIFRLPILIIIREHNGDAQTLTTVFTKIIAMSLRNAPANPDEILYFVDIEPKSVTRKY